MDVDRSAQNSGTGEVRSAHRFDEARLEAWLEANVEGFAGPLRVEQFATHRVALEEAPQAYADFQHKANGTVKVVFKP